MNELTQATPMPLLDAPVKPPVPLDPATLATAFSTRAARAAALVEAGAVQALGNGRYKVRSGGGGWWAVRPGYCNCPDFAWRGVVPCKHLIAVEMTRALAAPES